MGSFSSLAHGRRLVTAASALLAMPRAMMPRPSATVRFGLSAGGLRVAAARAATLVFDARVGRGFGVARFAGFACRPFDAFDLRAADLTLARADDFALPDFAVRPCRERAA